MYTHMYTHMCIYIYIYTHIKNAATRCEYPETRGSTASAGSRE